MQKFKAWNFMSSLNFKDKNPILILQNIKLIKLQNNINFK